MRSIPVKSAEQQAQTIVLTVRELFVSQRTQLINAWRGHATEFGVVAAKGTAQVARLLAALADNPAVPAAARAMLALLGERIEDIDGQIADVDRKLAAQRRANPVSRLLAEVPGIGPIGALTLALRADPDQFKSGGHFAAWLGLTPREHSTGGKQSIIFTLRDLRQASPFLSEPPAAVMPTVQCSIIRMTAGGCT